MTRTMSKATPAAASATTTSAWCVTVLLALFMLINYADKAVMGFAAQDILKDLGITAQEFGVIQSAFFWLFFAGAMFISSANINTGRADGTVSARPPESGLCQRHCGQHSIVSLVDLLNTPRQMGVIK
ncbi:hypothetical protein OG758_11610 [Streptomyces sp. NBC_01474]|uniref:hypothetical protein n=1 Tax=unclassified Streptomyces TaxID=2593676 RepID=UPI002DDA626B|nr:MULTISPECIES: hypothetical protein [unclassified Streptomyces]WSD94732.1 hypothetical protein OG758_11610 [Streptomyces sp. NBC_01474]